MKKTNYRIRLFYLVTALFWFVNYTYTPTLSAFAKSQGISVFMIGLISGSCGFMQMCLRIPLGITSDRLRKRKVFVIIGILLGGLAALGMYIFPSAAGLLIFRGMSGASAAAWVAYSVLFASYFHASDASVATTKISQAMHIGQIAAMLLGSWLAGAYGAGAPFILSAAVGAIGVCLAFGLVENTPDRKPISTGELLRVGLTPRLLSVSVLGICYQLIAYGTTQTFTPIYARDIGAPAFVLGTLTSLTTLFLTLAALMSRKLQLRSRFGERAIIVCAFAVTGLSVAAIPFTHSIGALMALQAVLGLCGGAFFPMLMGLAIESVPQEQHGVAMGFYQSIYGLGMFVGPVLTGALQEAFTIRSSFLAIAGVGFMAALLASLILPRKHGQRAA